MFRGRRLRFGGYSYKYMLKLFRRSVSQLDPDESDTRVYVQGKVRKLSAPILENNRKEDDILFYLQKHLRYAETFAQEEAQRRRSLVEWKVKPAFFGTPDERVLWLKRLYFGLPLYVRPGLYFFYRYFILLGFLDGLRIVSTGENSHAGNLSAGSDRINTILGRPLATSRVGGHVQPVFNSAEFALIGDFIGARRRQQRKDASPPRCT